MREDEPELGDLQNDFDFNQTPLAPVILPVQPQTDLIEPTAASTASGSRAARRALPGVKGLRPFEIAAAARYLVMTPAELRRGARVRGDAPPDRPRARPDAWPGSAQAVLAAGVRAELPQTLR